MWAWPWALLVSDAWAGGAGLGGRPECGWHAQCCLHVLQAAHVCAHPKLNLPSLSPTHSPTHPPLPLPPPSRH